jgi:dTDP-L-rhamnose 4-epimerase
VNLLATSEDSKIHPTSIYGITKQNQEQMTITVGRAIGMPIVALRYQNVYGPGQSLLNPYTGILSIFSNQILNQKDINIFEDGKESRDFVFIEDVVDATVLSIEKDEIKCDVFNIGSNFPIEVINVAQKLKDCYKSNIKLNVTGNYRIGDVRHNYAELNKAYKILGYEPKVMFDEGIELFTDWVRNQEYLEDKYEHSIKILAKRGLFK